MWSPEWKSSRLFCGSDEDMQQFWYNIWSDQNAGCCLWACSVGDEELWGQACCHILFWSPEICNLRDFWARRCAFVPTSGGCRSIQAKPLWTRAPLNMPGNKKEAWEQFVLAVEDRSQFTGRRAATMCQHRYEVGQGSLLCSITLKFLLNHWDWLRSSDHGWKAVLK